MGDVERKQRGRRERERRHVWSESRTCWCFHTMGGSGGARCVEPIQTARGPCMDQMGIWLHGAIHGCRRSRPFPRALLGRRAGAELDCAVLCNARRCVGRDCVVSVVTVVCRQRGRRCSGVTEGPRGAGWEVDPQEGESITTKYLGTEYLSGGLGHRCWTRRLHRRQQVLRRCLVDCQEAARSCLTGPGKATTVRQPPGSRLEPGKSAGVQGARSEKPGPGECQRREFHPRFHCPSAGPLEEPWLWRPRAPSFNFGNALPAPGVVIVLGTKYYVLV